jgi:DNA-binding winged helix-turn-helix (wHTH) protein/tetratricopeptide (TPR) repeat protein
MKNFPPFRLDTINQCLWRRRDKRDDERILLTPKSFAVLHYLVQHAGRLVTHDELLEAVWPGTYIQPQAIKKSIVDLRIALEDRAKKPLFIETLHRRGYRFIAAVSEGTGLPFAVPAAPARSRIVGREQPLAELRDCLENALRGERQIVFITGEPGIGKTALADESQRQAVAAVPGLRIALGQCVEGYGGKEAYYPMLEALGQLCRGPGGDSVVETLAAQAPTWLVQFPALVKREQREMLQREIVGATRERMLREIGDALETLTAASPLLLVLEDLQWVDHSTVDLISAMARRRAPAKLMLISTKRPLDIVVPEHPLKALEQELLLHHLCREITLEPLGEAQVAEYLAAESSEATLPEGLVKLLYSHTEGNPLFMVAALDHMIERGLVSREGGAWKLRAPLEEIALGVPQKLRRMIEAQINRLTPEEQRALEAASVAGMAFSPEICAAAAYLGRDTFEDLCEQLSRRHHIVRSAGTQQFPEGTVCSRYEFVHALYREVSYRLLAPARRANLHLHIGERLETLFRANLSKVAAELVPHFEEGSDWTRAVKYLQVEAETAGKRYAPREAADLLQHAVELSGKLPEEERAGNEIEILKKLAAIYLGSFDPRAVETYRALGERAAGYGLIDVEVHAFVEMAWATTWVSAPKGLELVEQALRLNDRQSDPLMRARTRMRCFALRLWAGGWNPQDAEECRNALAEIRLAGDRRALATHLLGYSFIQWISSEYREAYRSAVENLAVLTGDSANPYLTGITVYQNALSMLPCLMFLGEWGEALRGIEDAIAVMDKNSDFRSGTLLLYGAWAHFHALDFDRVVAICESVLPTLQDTPSVHLCLTLAASAQTALGNYDRALELVTRARNDIDRHPVVFDWYLYLLLESALTELWLAKGDLKRARAEAERFLQLALATAERTWQALAWEANSRIAIAEVNLEGARDCIAKALSTMEGFEVPLAAWRVHATAAELFARSGDNDPVEHHRELSRATIMKLANSLGPEEPLRTTFLSAPSVRKVLGNAEATAGTTADVRSSSPTKRVRKTAPRRS